VSETIRVLIADDHALVRYGLRVLLSNEPGIEVIGEAADGAIAVELAQALQPTVLLLDLFLPRKDGLQVILDLAEAAPRVHTLILTAFGEDDRLVQAIMTGALGYLQKESSPDELLAAIRVVARGESSLDLDETRRVLRELNRLAARPIADDLTLSAQESEVLRQVAKGISDRDIAEYFHLSEHTVSAVVSAILCKLHLTQPAQAALHALRVGIACFGA
jgi:DNA-binding NarL/FixJ family response regulator